MDALCALLHASLSSNKGRAIRLTYMAKPSESIMVLEDKRDAFHAAYTKTIQAGTTADRNQGWLAPCSWHGLQVSNWCRRPYTHVWHCWNYIEEILWHFGWVCIIVRQQQLLYIRKGNSMSGGETRQIYHCEGQGLLDVLRELKWMVHNHVMKGVQDSVSEAWH